MMDVGLNNRGIDADLATGLDLRLVDIFGGKVKGHDPIVSASERLLSGGRRDFPKGVAPQTPRSSRLVHGAGIIAMGYVMEYLYFSMQARNVADFKYGLRLLEGRTAWTSGEWDFEDRKPKLNELQNLNRDWISLSYYHISGINKAYRELHAALGPSV